MPRRDDIDSILILGSGPIVIGQACEFDYSGAQACKVLRAEGYRVVLVNSNPATIMTDPEFADATYIEPLTPGFVEKVIAKERRERPDEKLVVLPTLGGQTGLNAAVDLAKQGTLERYDIELVGAGLESIDLAEDRRAFNQAMTEIGLEQARAGRVSIGRDHDLTQIPAAMEQARALAEEFGFPVLVRASYTLGGAGSGVARDPEQFKRMVAEGLEASPIGEVQIDESLLGWKEYELEVMRDSKDNCVVICTIENLDPMGVHTGDSITVAPSQTLSDAEYQVMREAAFAVLRKVGVATGGSNVQFAVNPEDGRMVVIEMNPRVSRSSALASKATGFPIAKIAALLAVGYTLDEIPNDITGSTLAAFEPSIDYVVTKIPRWAFEKFPGADVELGTQMKSVGEVMAIGRTFKESLNKALRSLENGTIGLTGRGGEAGGRVSTLDHDELARAVARPTAHRIHDVDAALTRGWAPGEVARLSGYDPWFVDQMLQIVELRRALRGCELLANVPSAMLRAAKRMGFSDALIAQVTGTTEAEVRQRRHTIGLRPVYKTVDTCAAEFAATTPYYYSTYEEENEVVPTDRKRAMILGSGPNRIGQGIEFDYACVHAVFSMQDVGYEAVMVNCNPETVSTDYDTADRLYFEPLTLEDVLEVAHVEGVVAYSGPVSSTPNSTRSGPDPHMRGSAPDRDQFPGIAGALVQFGGQTPLKLAHELEAAGVPIMGTKPAAIDLAEDRGRFNAILDQLGIAQPPGDIARSVDDALSIADQIGFPVLVRPSYVLGGRAMEIVYTADQMREWLDANAGEGDVLVDRFFENAVEVDVDAVYDGTDVFVGGIMEHIEEAGIHSGDSACVVPPFTLGMAQQRQLRDHTRDIAAALGTRGLINIQFAVRDSEIVVIEANPRASRTVPFISKVTSVPLAKVAARVMAGEMLADMDLGPDAVEGTPLPYNAVKEAVLPFNRFPGVDTRLGPEMRSTGEVMGIDHNFGIAFAKSQAGTGSMVLPAKGTVFCSLATRDKRAMIFPIKRLAELGFEVIATVGTAETLSRAGVRTTVIGKYSDGGESVVDLINDGRVDLILNTPTGIGARADGYEIRTAAVSHGVPCVTTLPGILAAIQGIEALQADGGGVAPLQEHHTNLA
ncbi:carbamoyl-phosphate synthase large subunit [Euzebya tangerina]|uniref:carbamoyl-phosphate synthase large subunit n=1 Tax=Euzebya tangerina TaxID=591198 RepID=UPI000E31A0DB|nr:carbamoyl-phosphate synthase large subunit [Euzebya tangerina]